MQLKAELESLIAEQHPSIRIVAADKSTKSEVWDNDCYLMVFRDNIKQEFALCSMCRSLITYKSCYGTGSLIRHSCFRKRKRDNIKRKLDESMGGGTDAVLLKIESKPSSARKKYHSSAIMSTTPDITITSTPSPPTTTSTSSSMPSVSPHHQLNNNNNSKHLEMLIKNKDPSIELVDRTRDEWIYKDIYNYGRRQDFVFCMVCHKTVSKYSYIQRTHQCFVDFMTGSNSNNNNSNSAGGGTSAAANVNNHHTKAFLEAATKAGLLIPQLITTNNNNNNNLQSPPPHTNKTELSATSSPQIYFNMDDKQELVQQQLYFMYHDLVPAKMLDGKGFQRLAQCLINIGAIYGKVPVKNCLIDSDTMYNQQQLIVETIRHNIKGIFQKYKIVFSCDMWSDVIRNMKCLTLTAHYIDDNFELKKIVLGTKRIAINYQYNNKSSSDANKVLQQIHGILENYTESQINAEKLLSHSVIVSCDDGLMINSFHEHNRIACACYSLNAIVNAILKCVQHDIDKICADIKLILDTIKETKCGHKIAPLYNEHLSSWDLIWQLFAIINDPDVRDVIDKMSISIPNYEPYLKILQPFRLASLALSSEIRPTLNAVYMFRKKLEDSLALSYFDEPENIKLLKMNGLKMIQEQFPISSLHKIALFLDPRFKSLKFFTNDERIEIIDMVKRMSTSCSVKQQHPQQYSSTASSSSLMKNHIDSSSISVQPKIEIETNKSEVKTEKIIDSTPPPPPPQVRIKCEDGQSEYLIEYMDDHTSDTESHSELNVYMSLKSDVTHSGDILKFWQSRTDMPHLQQLAKEILCIPASATTCDQLFSIDAKLLSKRRLFMEPDELDRTLLIHGTSPNLSM